MNNETPAHDHDTENPFPNNEQESRTVPEMTEQGSGTVKKINLWKIVAVLALLLLAALAGVLAKIMLTPREIIPEPVVLTPEEPKTTTTDTGVIQRQALTITWIPLAEQMATTSSELALFESFLQSPEAEDEFFYGPETVIKLGTVNGGKYDGWTLALHRLEEQGLGTYFSYYYTIHPPSEIDQPSLSLSSYAYNSGGIGYDVAETQYTTRIEEYTATAISDNGALIIPELEDYPQHIKDEQGREYTFSGVSGRLDDAVGAMQKHTANAIPTNFGPLAMTGLLESGGDPNGFALFRPMDGVAVYYDLIIPFWDNTQTSQSLNIKWDDKPDARYAPFLKSQPGGCGPVSNTNVVNPADIGDIVPGGSILRGDEAPIRILVPTDYSREHYQPLFATWQFSHPTGTLAEFAATHPIFFYQDSWGRWIEFQSADIVPMAECGKPVIYLYPERGTDLTVTLDPQGGFTYTEPIYRNGWRVHAEPDGTLTNVDDGRVYPYLFWEGQGGAYSSPSRYWVVTRDDVEGFLTETLRKLGLNEKETADFNAFWLPHMQSAPWYKIGFHGTRVMDRLAPLSLSQTPDTVIRILMDYEALDREIPSNPPRLPLTPTRKGFTVIEWGGVLRR